MKKKMKLDGSASGTGANDDRETLKPSLGKRKRNQADEDRLKAQMGEGSSNKDQTPTQSRRTPLFKKTLTYDDVLTSKLTIPPEYAGVLLPKRPERKHDRIMVPFKDNKGGNWEMEATDQGLSLKWDKFVKEHGLQPNDVIFFYNDDPSSDYYNIDYEKNEDAFFRIRLIDCLNLLLVLGLAKWYLS